MRIVDLNETTKRNLLSDLLKRDPNNYEEYAGVVQEIIDQVKEKGDEAVFAYTEKFDKARTTGDNVRVTKAEIEEARAFAGHGTSHGKYQGLPPKAGETQLV